jgi:glycerol-3-phosphate acyltransferase PlsY
MSYIPSIVIGYFFGSIPFGYIAGRLAGKDIRQEGYHRIGASNVYSVLGFIPAVFVFFGDFFKGVVPIVILTLLGVSEPVASVAGVSAIVGHNWPIFLAFKGEGRGFATSCGVLYYLLPLETICGFAFFILLVIMLKSSPLPTFIFACIMPILVLLFPEPLWTFGISLSISLLLVFTRIVGGLRQIEVRRNKGSAILNLILYDGVRR